MTQASDKFKTWNEANKICYFPHQRRLRFFNSYLQDNCKRECAWNKWVARCKENLFIHPDHNDSGASACADVRLGLFI